MRILQILPELNVGGVETGTVDLAKYFTAKEHHIVVVSNGGPLTDELKKKNIRHYILPVHKKSFWHMIRCVGALAQIIVQEKIEIVHARSRVPAWIAFFAARKTKTAFITTCHGYYGVHWFSRVMGWGKLVIVPSEVIGRHMISDFNVPAERIRLIPRSVDLQKFHVPRHNPPGKSQFVVSIVGRITPLKGHAYFLKAMAKVVRSMPFVKIWVIGDAPAKKEGYKQELELLVKHLGLKENVEFLGNRRDIPQLLAQTDCLVLSTVTQEAFGRVILEAQAAGVPVVATRVGGVVEIIDDGETGILVQPKDVDGMAQQVLRILKDKKLADQLVVAAKKKLENRFTLEQMAESTLKVYDELLRLTSILVIKLSSMGDVVLVTASLKALREKFPAARLFCLVGKESRKILQRCPYLDGLIVFDGKEKNRGWWGLLKFSRKLREYKFDKVIDFQNNQKSHWLAFLSFPRESYGYRNNKFGFLLSHGIKDDAGPIPPVRHQFRILKQLGIDSDSEAALKLWPSDEDRQYAQALLDSEWMGTSAQVVGVNIAASEKWVTKNWPLEHLAKLCDLLAAKNIRVFITGMEKDKSAVRELLKMTRTKPADFVGKTDILQLAALIARCHVYVTPDSAPMHVAAAMGVPFVALFGPTDSNRHLPPSPKFKVVKRDLNCGPCYSSRCRILTHACMKDITPGEIMSEINKLLGAKP